MAVGVSTGTQVFLRAHELAGIRQPRQKRARLLVAGSNLKYGETRFHGGDLIIL